MNNFRSPLRILIMAFALLLVPGLTRASDAKPAADAHGDDHAAEDAKAKPKEKEKPKAKAKAKPQAKSGLPSLLPVRSDQYVHHWLPFPLVEGRQLQSGQKFNYKAKPGRAVVVIFLASWCVPCQQMVKPLKELQAKFSERYTDFIYVFAHDTEPDAKGFTMQYQLENEVILGSAALLESFHQPELPSIYVGDRYNWMVMRKLNTQNADLDEIGSFLDIHTSL